MGLLIGASVLSLFEVVDLFLYNFLVKLVNRRDAFTKIKDSSMSLNNLSVSPTQNIHRIDVKS